MNTHSLKLYDAKSGGTMDQNNKLRKFQTAVFAEVEMKASKIIEEAEIYKATEIEKNNNFQFQKASEEINKSTQDIKKKLKDKAFAKAVDRDQIKSSAEELGVELTEHIQTVIDSLVTREAELKEEGLSLID